MKVKHILFFAACINLFSQSDKRDYDEELRYQNQAINGLKKEINQLRLKIKTAESREKSAKNRISSIDQELSLTNELIQSQLASKAVAFDHLTSLGRLYT